MEISGSKNAALKIIPAALFWKHSEIRNVPDIGDIRTLLAIIETLGVRVEFQDRTVRMDTTKMSLVGLDRAMIKKIRVGIMLIPALLARFGSVEVPYPGGCNIGKRGIDEHLEGFRSMGYTVNFDGENIRISGMPRTDHIACTPYFSVTATENMLIANAWRPGTTRIDLTATEPHVMNLVDSLRHMGADIRVNYDHSIDIIGAPLDPEKKFEATIIHDYIESGTFVVFGALASEKYIDIKNARIQDLASFLAKCREAGVRMEDLGDDTLRVHRSEDLKAVKFQTNIFPGFPTDLQSIFGVLLTQADGISRVQEIMFE